MKEASEIKNYYNEFSKTIFLRDFRIVNARLEAIKKLCDRFVPHGAKVLEIGCGAGIISKHLQKKVAFLLGLDISETAIKMAQLYVADPNCEFKVYDVTADAAELNRYGKFDVILLADVLEHIPLSKQNELFNKLENLLGPAGIVLITCPSAEYQEYLKQNKPELLQVVDETLRLPEILEKTALQPCYFSYVDAGEKNQYLHLILKMAIDYSPTPRPTSLVHKIRHKIKKVFWQWQNRAFLRKVENVF